MVDRWSAVNEQRTRLQQAGTVRIETEHVYDWWTKQPSRNPPATTMVKYTFSYWHLHIEATPEYGAEMYAVMSPARWLSGDRYQLIKQRTGGLAHMLVVDTQIADAVRDAMKSESMAQGGSTDASTAPVPALDETTVALIRSHNRTSNTVGAVAALVGCTGGLLLGCTGLFASTMSAGVGDDAAAIGLLLCAVAVVIAEMRPYPRICVPGCRPGELPLASGTKEE